MHIETLRVLRALNLTRLPAVGTPVVVYDLIAATFPGKTGVFASQKINTIFPGLVAIPVLSSSMEQNRRYVNNFRFILIISELF